LVEGTLLALLAAVGIWNAFTYPPDGGYDAAEHLAYAQALIEDGSIPGEGAFYTPPGFYVVAGAATKLGEALGLEEPERIAQLVNAILAVATAILVLALARLLFPGRPLLRWSALGFFVCCPVVLKTAAMFHPQTLALFVSTAALTFAAWMIVRRRYDWWAWLGLAALLGAGQLVRSVSIWTFGVVLVAFVVVAATRQEDRRPVGRALAVVLVAAIVLPLPWYVHLQRSTGSSIFGRSGTSLPLWDRWPGSFYVSPGLPDVITHPQREALPPRFFPVVYTETWGDYFGIWSWGPGRPALTDAVNDRLVLQSVVGAPLTMVGIAGWLALVALSLRRLRRRSELLLVTLMPLAAIVGTLYYAVRNPTPDGDVVKGLYMLTAVPAWAISFGFVVDAVVARSRTLGIALGVALAACGAVALAFAVA
jgi:4-amino-4-deoxy-L-arabinose transferase-like glycosyltransferase